MEVSQHLGSWQGVANVQQTAPPLGIVQYLPHLRCWSREEVETLNRVPTNATE